MLDGKLHVGIGFATGRKSFQNVLRAYLFHLEESDFLSGQVVLSLFVAYDLSYADTIREDYTKVGPIINDRFIRCSFLGPEDIRTEAQALCDRGVIGAEEVETCFGNGYAAQRNIVLYKALEQQVDQLIFIDDDEYPMAVTHSGEYALWSGQHVIEDHVKYLQFADVTNGYHCGYVSPLPALELDGIVDEQVFKHFVSALSSDVLKWDDFKMVMQAGGVTYADKQVLIDRNALLVEEEHGAKFITGSNLGLNLTNRDKVLPFYNPPGARGEDSFLSTCLTHHTVKRIPCYTFHDGFSLYGTLLHGTLPTKLKEVTFYDSATVIRRFSAACTGWIRYKPLYTYITNRKHYRAIMDETRKALAQTVPKMCAYFNNDAFSTIPDELARYDGLVEEHYAQFQHAQLLWKAVRDSVG